MVEITSLETALGGAIGICSLPGRFSDLANDLDDFSTWNTALIISMTTQVEMDEIGAGDLGNLLQSRGMEWRHLPVRDFGGLTGENENIWPDVSKLAQETLAAGNNVLIHCRGGHGRSGMIALRLLVELGEQPKPALKRLRDARPGAVETQEQLLWASMSARNTP